MFVITAKAPPLNPRQCLFVEEYLVDLNGKEAAIRAGYASTAASVRAAKLLRRPRVKQAIADAMAARAARTEITAERILEEYAAVAFADMRDLADWGPAQVRLRASRRLVPNETRAIAELWQERTHNGGRARLRRFDKLAALNSLARILGNADSARFATSFAARHPPLDSPAAPALLSRAPRLPPPADAAWQRADRRDHFAPRQRRFANEFLKDFDAGAAAIRAGYAPRSAPYLATKLRHYPHIAALIAAGIEARCRPIRAEADRVIAEYAAIAFADIGRIADWNNVRLRLKPMRKVAPADSAAIAQIGDARGMKLRLKLHDKVYALDMLARHLGLLDPRMPGRAPRQSDGARRTGAALRQRLERVRRQGCARRRASAT